MSCHFFVFVVVFCVHIVPEICNPTKSSRREDRGSHLQITLSYAATQLWHSRGFRGQYHSNGSTMCGEIITEEVFSIFHGRKRNSLLVL